MFNSSIHSRLRSGNRKDRRRSTRGGCSATAHPDATSIRLQECARGRRGAKRSCVLEGLPARLLYLEFLPLFETWAEQGGLPIEQASSPQPLLLPAPEPDRRGPEWRPLENARRRERERFARGALRGGGAA